MKTYSAFEIIGPRMIGPSSSHTAGAVRLGKVARRICERQIQKVEFMLHGSFAKTYKGHGTDKALIAGILGMDPEDQNLKDAMQIAKMKGIEYKFVETDLGSVHPNTVNIKMWDEEGNTSQIMGSSIGGGSIKVTQINGLDVEFTGEYPTLIVRQIDVPGVVAKVAKVMGEFKINIAFMRVFRQDKGKDAFMIIEADDQIPKEVVEKMKNAGEEIRHVYLMEGL